MPRTLALFVVAASLAIGTPTAGARSLTVREASSPAGADASVTLSDSADPVLVGRSFADDASVGNDGGSIASSVTVTFTLPAEVTLTSAPAGCDVAPVTITCALGDVAPGEIRTLSIVMTASSSGTPTLTASVTTTAPDQNAGNDTASEATTILGPADCTVTGTEGDDRLVGTSGTDVLCGRGGDDVLRPKGGDDLVVGGTGADVVSYAGRTTRVTVDLAARTAQTGSGIADLVGVEGARGSTKGDTLLGNAKPNLLAGLGGNDTMDGRGGMDTADYSVCGRPGCSADAVTVDLSKGTATGLGAGTDRLRGIENVYGSLAGNDRITGDAAANWLYGFGGNDVVRGLGGNDYLGGWEGNDHLEGEAGDDFLDGSLGTDACFGGPGIDSLVGCP